METNEIDELVQYAGRPNPWFLVLSFVAGHYLSIIVIFGLLGLLTYLRNRDPDKTDWDQVDRYGKKGSEE